ncbi:MAG: TonB-dependent receptor plug domain-containing protein, partial [Saprospiraceae bacterium]|nr:TonB-dependent receptor plug domain-containing protein [Saprospiraceae bacterium]
MNLIRNILLACLLVQALPFFAQECKLTVAIYVTDSASDIPLAYSTIYIDEIEFGMVTDSIGYASLNNQCPGPLHIEIGHLGCSTQSYFIQLISDTILRFKLEHHSELLDEIVVHGHQDEGSTEVSSTITFNEISSNSNKNIADVLNAVPGVRSLKNGGISKPIIHGLFGNRVALVNNGLVQSGQQWGNDHAPEIDPFSADHIAVIKGAGAMEYGTNAVGGVVLVDSDIIGDDPHLSGQLNYLYETNGRGHTINGALQESNNTLSWRWTGTFKRKGDSSTPEYLLNNTGLREINSSIHMEQNWNQRHSSTLNYALFTTKLGVLRGSQIGNLTDLEQAIIRDEPFYTSDTFSYSIDAPNQNVTHHLLKLQHDYFLSDQKAIILKYGGQLNQRDEFDVRRGGRSDTPALSLNQYQHFGSIVYNQEFKGNAILKSGLQVTFTDNANNPGTGILPLIPRYEQWVPAFFTSWQNQRNKWTYEMGVRYELRYLDVTNITQTLPRELEFISHKFENIASSIG